jgi:hypothetical protein
MILAAGDLPALEAPAAAQGAAHEAPY